MASGFGDAAMLKDALELARSFKSSGKQDTYGGVKKSKKKNSSAQPFRYQAPLPPPVSARGVPNVSMRNYPTAGSFVARESNNKSKGPPVMSAALDFLNRQDRPVNSPAPKMEIKPSMAQPPSCHTQLSSQDPEVIEKQKQEMKKRDQEARAKKMEAEARLEQERKDRIAEKLKAMSLSNPKPAPVQPTIQPAPSAQHPLNHPQATVQTTASTPQRDIQTPAKASAVSSPSTGRSGSAQPPTAKTGTGSQDANIWGNFLKFAPRGLVSATSEVKASPSKSQLPDSARAVPVQPAPAQTAPAQPALARTTPILTTPVQNKPTRAAPIQAAPIQVAPVKAAPIQTAPTPTAPIQTAPAQTAPVNVAPVNVAPVKVAPVKVAPVKVAPVKTAPAPIKAAPTQAAPVPVAPIQAAPIQAAPSQPTPVQHGGKDRNNSTNQAQRLQFSEFVPGRSNHHAVLEAAPQQNFASQQPGLGSSRWAVSTADISMQPSALKSFNGPQNGGGSVFGSMPSNATASSSNQVQTFPVKAQNLFMSSQVSHSGTPAAPPARKPKQGLASSLWASR